MLQQLSVFVENKIGSVHKVTTALCESDINLRAISTFDSPDFSILRMVVDQPESAKKALSNQGFLVKVTSVLAVELQDKPGDLDRVLGILEKAGHSINYIYSLVLRGEKSPLMVMNVSDMEKAERVLAEHNITIVD